jgi:hypothetical protein
MNKEKAQEILGGWIQEDGRLYSVGAYLAWRAGDDCATLDGDFTADELEAIAWWMRNTEGKGDSRD